MNQTQSGDNGRYVALEAHIAPSHVDHLICQRGNKGLQLLLEAYEYAQQLSCSVWEFGLEIELLERAGVTPNDLRWLLLKGLLLHGKELTAIGDQHRVVRSAGARRFSRSTCFVLTEAGAEYVRAALKVEPRCSSQPVRINGYPEARPLRPIWDRDRQELRLGVAIVKRFKAPAPNQELILAAFEEEGWPVHIDDPLPPHADQEPRRRLHDTINSLNRNQKMALIRFIGDGSGQGIRWEFSQLLPQEGQTELFPNSIVVERTANLLPVDEDGELSFPIAPPR